MHSVCWRFHARLNDFLPRERRGQSFRQALKPAPSAAATRAFGQTVKDAFEALGVPHPEVAVILVNDQPVDFTYQLRPDDAVVVYPHGEAPNVDERWQMPFLPPGKPRFILDVHLGALVRYLRLAGFDCCYQARDPGDAQIAELAQQQQRVVLTRDVGLLKRNQVSWGYRLRNVQPKLQFREVVAYFGLKPWFDPFNRCSLCNSEQLVQLSRADALRQMPEGVPAAIEELWSCQCCGKVYWQGSHYDGIQDFMRSV